MNKLFSIHEFLKTRPLSWSAIASFEYSPKQWHDKYIKKEDQIDSPEMFFGSEFAFSCERGEPMRPVTLLSKMEQSLEFEFDGIPIVGFMDTFDDKTLKEIGEYKTGVKEWDKKRVDNHGQITLYALGNYILNKVRPEECKFWLEWMPTIKVPRDNNSYSGFDYEIQLDPAFPLPIHFDTKRTMQDLLTFGLRIKKTLSDMERCVRTYAK